MAIETNWGNDLLGQRVWRDGVEVLPTKKSWEFFGADVVYNSTTGRVEIYCGGGGFDWQESVRVATTADLAAVRVGDTLTASGNGNINTLGGIDGIITLAVGDRVLVKNEVVGADNNIYELTDLGTAATPFVLQWAELANETGEVTPGMTCNVEEGAVNGGRYFRCSNTGTIALGTTAIVFSVWTAGSLVTVAWPGTVNALGAANRVLTTDGATAGAAWTLLVNANIDAAAAIDVDKLATGAAANYVLQSTGAAPANEWRAYLALGAGPPATGTQRWSNGTTVDALDAAGTGTYRVIDAGATTADHVTIGTLGAALDGVDIVVGATGTFELRRGAAQLLTADGTTLDAQGQAITTTSTCALNAAASWLRVGLAAGSGAGSAAAAGAVRLIFGGSGVVYRNATDAADAGGLSLQAGNVLAVGGPYPTTPTEVKIDGASYVRLAIGASNKIILAATTCGFYVANWFFGAAVAAPTFYQEDDATAGVTADTLADHAQDAVGVGATVGGDRTIRAGSGATGGTLRLKNPSATDRLTVHPSYAQITAGERLAGYRTVAFADSPVTVAATDRVIRCNVVGGSITLNLPAVATSAGMLLTVKDTGSCGAALSITVEADGAETIDGALNDVLGGGAGTAYASRTYFCNGTTWDKWASYL